MLQAHVMNAVTLEMRTLSTLASKTTARGFFNM